MIALLLLAALSPQEAAQNTSGGVLMEEQAAFDVLHYGLDLEVSPESKSILGSLTMTARLLEPTREIVLQLDPGLEVSRILGGKDELLPLGFSRQGGDIWIGSSAFTDVAGEDFKVVVEYGGVPHEAERPPWEGGFTWSEADGEPWIATSCQGEGADLWWPCKDHPSDKPESMDLSFTVPEGLVVATNGRRIGSSTLDGKTTSQWRVSTPIANYTVAFNAAPYVELVGSLESVAGDTFPVIFWVLPENKEKGEAFMAEILEHLRFFERVCGPYPFRGDKYGVVETPHLGMEHQSIIAYGNKYRGDPNFDYDWLHHHELSHEWWANLVTCDDWADFWIHEGFGTYMQALYLESRFGEEAYRKKLEVDWKRVSNVGPIAPRAPRATQDMYFAGEGSDAPGGDIYFKGSWFLHNLRWLMGDEPFFRFLRRLTYPTPESEQDAAHPPVHFLDTAGVVKAATAAAGTDLQWYFDAVVRQKELPVLEVWAEDRTLHLQWRTANGRPYPMPVEVMVEGEAVRVDCPSGHGRLDVGTRTWEVDPKRWLLRKR